MLIILTSFIAGLVASSVDIIQPLIMGCETKNPRIVQICLVSVQRLIQHEAISLVSPKHANAEDVEFLKKNINQS